jgi:ectoine hydroxylase-related dioxygenase (phytanoyl-CoA dioxygenase family)
MTVTDAERAAGTLTPEHLAAALRRLREAGYVAFESLIPQELTRELRDAFQVIHEEEFRDRKSDAGWNRRGGRGARFEHPFMHPLMIENPIGMQVMEAAMGDDLWGMLPYHTNTSFPGAREQGVHRDTPHLFPELTHALPPAMLILHVPLIDFTEENGSTELWPGTHLITDVDPHTGERLDMAERARDMPSVRTNIPAGSLVVRDMRVWHRATPNHSDAIRTMTSMVYFRQFHRFPQHLTGSPSQVPKDARGLLSARAQKLYRYSLEG